MKKALHALTAAALLSGPAYAFGGGAETAAASYCAARDAGQSHEAGIRNMSAVLANGFGSSINDMIVNYATAGTQTAQAAGYMAKRMCPEHFRPQVTVPSTVKPVWATKASDHGYSY